MKVPNNSDKKPDTPQQKRNKLIVLGIAVFFLLLFLFDNYNRGQTGRDLEEGMSDTMREYCALIRQQGGTDKDCE